MSASATQGGRRNRKHRRAAAKPADGAHPAVKATYSDFRIMVITGSIARRRYLIYSEADYEVFRPTVGVKFRTEEGTAPPCQISPPSVERLGYRTPKLKFLLRFDQNVEYKRPAWAYPLRKFHKNLQSLYPV